MFDGGDLLDSYIARIRLEVGDTSRYPFFQDSVYEYLYQKANGDELGAAIAVLEAIINTAVVSPDDVRVGDIQSANSIITFYQDRLLRLREKKASTTGDLAAAPLAIRTDRRDWNDFNNLFKGSKDY